MPQPLLRPPQSPRGTFRFLFVQRSFFLVFGKSALEGWELSLFMPKYWHHHVLPGPDCLLVPGVLAL